VFRAHRRDEMFGAELFRQEGRDEMMFSVRL